MKIAACAIACAAACVHVADERARRDETIGQAELPGGTRLEVEDGLAAVRLFEPGQLVLWAGAPVVSARLVVTGDAPLEWRITMRNILDDAALTMTTSGGAVVPGELEWSTLPTERRWRFTLPGAGEHTLLLRPPDADDLAPWRFGVFADVQEDVDRVGDIFARMNAEPALRFVVMTGDLTRRGSPGELERFQSELQRLALPCYATLGNHELGVREDLFHDYFGRGNFRFGFRGAQLTLLDSASATLAPAVHEWVDRWLDEGRDRFHAVFMHIPPLDPIGTRNGGFASRSEAHALVGALARGGVDLTIYGHLHSFYAYENAGIPAYISGGGGAVPERFDGIGRHFLVIDVDPVTSTFATGIVRVD